MSKTTMTRALLLAAHGSLKNGQSSEAVFEHAQRIRDKGVFDEVRAIFWKEEPYFHQAADIVGSDSIYIVPFFMSHGYFTRQILLRELESSPSNHSHRMIITKPVGTHPDMLQILLSQIRKSIPTGRLEKSAIALIGHGTPKDEQSSAAIYHLADQVRKQSRYNNIKCFFLDEEPLIENIFAGYGEKNIHIFPIFIGEGLHTQVDIPERLQFDPEPPVYGTHLIQDSGRTLNYHPPLGVLPESSNIIMQRLMESDVMFDSQESSDSKVNQTYLRPAAQFFLNQFERNHIEGLSWGELKISQIESHTYDIRHGADALVSGKELREFSAKDAWRLAKQNSADSYRPLKARPDLQSGWIIRQMGASELIQVLDHFYPTAIDNWYRKNHGQLAITQFKLIANRQIGFYRRTREVTQDELRIFVERCCSKSACLKSNLWSRSGADGTEQLLCSEPCALFMEEARKIVKQSNSDKIYEEHLQ